VARVLIITERFYPEEFIINDLVLELTEKGLVCDILTQAPSYPFGKVSAYPGYKNRFFWVDHWNGIKIYRIMTIQGYRESKVRKVINYLQFGVFCSLVLLFIGRKYKKIFVFHSGPLTVATPAIIAKKIFRTTNTIWSLDLWPDTIYMYGFKRSRLNQAMLDRFVRIIYHQFDAIYVSSPAFPQRLSRYVTTLPIRTLLQWPQTKAENSENTVKILKEGSFHFTFTGNVAWTQNLENVILGFSLAHKEHPQIMLHIFGDGSNLEYLKRLTTDRQVENVTFWGRRPLAEMPAIYEQSQVLVLSLQPDPVYELYVPFKFSTYLAFQKPIFGVINGVVNDLINNNNIGITSDPGNLEDIKNGFSRFAMMPVTQMEEFGRNSSMLLENEFNREKNIAMLYKTLQKPTGRVTK
jgi:glycosyltransferase involved in cell wall biosynthesis